MHRDMRKSERAVSQEDAAEILERVEYGVLSTVCSDGSPYGCPLSYAYINGAVFCHCAKEGLKLDNIKLNSSVSFCVVGQTEILPEKFSTKYESVIVSGTAHEAEGEEKEKALISLIEKYSPGHMENGKDYIKRAADKTSVIKIVPENITGKARR